MKPQFLPKGPEIINYVSGTYLTTYCQQIIRTNWSHFKGFIFFHLQSVLFHQQCLLIMFVRSSSYRIRALTNRIKIRVMFFHQSTLSLLYYLCLYEVTICEDTGEIQLVSSYKYCIFTQAIHPADILWQICSLGLGVGITKAQNKCGKGACDHA